MPVNLERLKELTDKLNRMKEVLKDQPVVREGFRDSMDNKSYNPNDTLEENNDYGQE